MGPPPGPPGSAPGGPAAVESREIPIPADLIGGMIGPGGSTINDLRKQAGPTVLIAIVPGSVPAAQGGQQIARISGNAEAVNDAEILVRAKLQELADSGGGGPGLNQGPGPGSGPRPMGSL